MTTPGIPQVWVKVERFRRGVGDLFIGDRLSFPCKIMGVEFPDRGRISAHHPLFSVCVSDWLEHNRPPRPLRRAMKLSDWLSL